MIEHITESFLCASFSTVVRPSVITYKVEPESQVLLDANPWMCAAMSNTGEDSSNSTYLPLRHHSKNVTAVVLKATSTCCLVDCCWSA